MKLTTLHKKIRIAFLLYCICCCINSSFAQTGSLTPGGMLDMVYDNFGNKYPLQQLGFRDTLKLPYYLGPGNPLAKLVVPTCSSGYFQMYLDSACGMERYDTSSTQLARLQVVCQVLHDISGLINSPCASTGQKVNIWVRSSHAVNFPIDAGAAASPFYFIPDSTGVSGIADNAVWVTLMSGQDAYKGVVSPLLHTEFFHSQLVINFDNINWNTSLTSAPGSTALDLYTVVLHEICHSLGIFSLIDSSGASRIPNFSYYSRFDMFLRWSSTHLITQPGGTCSPLYNYSFAISPSVLHPAPGSCVTDYTNCSTALQYFGTDTLKLYTPNCWETGSSISHFEDECPPYNNNNGYFVMSNAISAGVMKRALTPEERHVLCDIGYNVGTTFGNSANLNATTYSGGTCSGIQVAGICDGITSTGTYKYVTSAGTAVTLNSSSITGLLYNDYNADSISCLQVVMGGTGTFNVTSGNSNTTITYTPASGSRQGTHLLRYVPVNRSTGKCGNITYVFVRVSSSACTGSACSMLVNGDFESSTGCGAFSGSGIVNANYTIIDCWDMLSGQPDLYDTTCLYPYLNGYIDCGIPTSESTPPTYVHQNSVGPNHHFIALNSAILYGNLSNEAVQTTLTTGLVSGTTYNVTFWGKIMGTTTAPHSYPILNIGTHIQFCASSSTLVPINSPFGAVIDTFTGIKTLKDTLVTADGQWHPYSLNFTYTGTSGYANFIVTSAPYLDTPGFPTNYSTYAFLDDFTLKALGGATFNLPDSVKTCDTFANLISYVSGASSGTFTGNGITVSGSTYNFYPAQALAVSGNGLQTITFNYTDVNGCSQHLNRQVYVKNNNPNLHASANYDTACSGQQITLTATGGAHYRWTPSTGLSCDTCAVTYAYPSASTIYGVYSTDTSLCPSVATDSVGVLDTAIILLSGPDHGCAGYSVEMTALAMWPFYPYQLYLNSPANLTYQWYLNNTAIPGTNNLLFYASATGIYKVGIIVNGHCTIYSQPDTITIDTPAVSIHASGVLHSCLGNRISLSTTPSYTVHAWSVDTGTGTFHSIGTGITDTIARAGIYKVVITDSLGCTNSVKDTIHAYPLMPVVTGSSTGICPGGTTVTLTTSSVTGSTFVWNKNGTAIIPTATGTSYSATSIGRYSVTETDSVGCTITSANDTLTTGTTPPASITAPATTICPGFSLILTANTGTGYTYQWRYSGSNISGADSITHAAGATGSYTVVVTSAQGCKDTSSAFTVGTTTDPCAPCNVWGSAAYTIDSGTTISGTLTGNHYITHSATISTTTSFHKANIFFAPGVKLTLTSGAVFYVDSSHLFSCSGHTWSGIRTTSAEHVVVQNSAVIEDADTAFVIRGSSIFFSEYAVFNKNVAGVVILNNPDPATYLSFSDVVFTSRDLGSSATYWPTPDIFKANVSTSTSYPYDTVTYDSVGCNNGLAASVGIYVGQTGSTDVSSYPFTFTDVTIGGAGTSYSQNVFDNLATGISANGSSVTLENNAFIHCGNGVYFNSDPTIFDGRLRIWNNGTAVNNRFYDCRTGVLVEKAFEVIGQNAYMISNHTATTTYRGLFGYNLVGGVYHDAYLAGNTIINTTDAISVIKPLFAYANGLQFNQNPAVVNGQGTYIKNDTLLVVPAGDTIGHNEFMDIAINVQMITNGGGVPLPTSGLYCDSNHIHDSYTGIAINNVRNTEEEVKNNYISMRFKPGYAIQGGVYMWYSWGGKIEQNNIRGNAIIVDSNWRGVYMADNSQYQISCDSAQYLPIDFEFDGQQAFFNHGATWINNNMGNSQNGFVLGGTIGTQGNANYAIGDVWYGTWAGAFYSTYTLSSADSPQNSTLYVLSSDPAQVPSNNQSLSISLYNRYSLGNGIATATTPNGGTCEPYILSIARGRLLPFENAATNQSFFASNNGLTQWLGQMQLYQYMSLDSVLFDSSSILPTFYTNAANSRIGYLNNIENYIVQGYLDSASALLATDVPGNPSFDYTTGVVIDDSGAADGVVANYKNFYGAYINYLDKSMTSTDSSTIVTLAGQCPNTNGAVVYQARALYAVLYNDPKLFNDNTCYHQTSGLHGKAVPNQTGQVVNAQKQAYRLYPNPNNGLLYVVQATPDTKPVMGKVWNENGQCIYNGDLVFKANSVRLELGDPTPGLYLLELTDSDGNNYALKFVVNY